MLTNAGFVDIQITLKTQAREIISAWMPNSGAEDYVTSVYCQARLPSDTYWGSQMAPVRVSQKMKLLGIPVESVARPAFRAAAVAAVAYFIDSCFSGSEVRVAKIISYSFLFLAAFWMMLVAHNDWLTPKKSQYWLSRDNHARIKVAEVDGCCGEATEVVKTPAESKNNNDSQQKFRQNPVIWPTNQDAKTESTGCAPSSGNDAAGC